MLLAAALPPHTGYVAAAYLVFVALLVIYVGIMARKLGRLQREAKELDELARRAAEDQAHREDDRPKAHA